MKIQGITKQGIQRIAKTIKGQEFTCEICGAPGAITCDDCHADRLRSLLDSPEWVENAKTRSGDFPGETMVDTITRELKSLSAKTIKAQDEPQHELGELLPEDLVAQYEERADAEREAGGSIDIDDMLPAITVKMSSGEDYFFQEWQADDLLDRVPNNISPEDYILAMAQNW
jgi:hypothetical protein